MSFEEYLRQGEIAREAAKSFRYSERKLPEYPEPDEAQKAEILAAAREIARDIAAKFDAARTEQEPVIADYFAQAQAYMTAPVPFGTLPTPPPIALYQSLALALGHWAETCKSFVNDADLLAAAGAGEFKAYLAPLLDDAAKALAKVQATPTGLFSASSANHGAGPGPDPNFAYNPFTPPPIPGLEPYMPPMGSPFGGAMMPPPMGGFPPMGMPLGMPPGMMPGLYPPPPPMPGYTSYFGGPMTPLPFAPPGMAPPAGAGGGPMTPMPAANFEPMIKAMQEQTDMLTQMNRDRQKAFDEANREFVKNLKS